MQTWRFDFLRMIVVPLLVIAVAACAPVSTPASAPAPTLAPAAAPTSAATSSNSASSSAASGQATSQGSNASVSLKNIAYNPNSLTVHVGTTVVWTNDESNGTPHTVTSGTPNSPSGTLDSATLNPGQSFNFTFSKAGTFTYYCKIHGASMTGTVTVTP